MLKDSYRMYKDDLNQLLSSFVGQANILTVPRAFIQFFGNIEKALIFHQCLYWGDRTDDENRWFYKSYKDWYAELGLTEYQVRKAVRSNTFLETSLRKAQGSPTLHYRVKWDEFSESFLKFLKNRFRKNFSMEPEITSESLPTETTPEITIKGEEPHTLPDWIIMAYGLPGWQQNMTLDWRLVGWAEMNSFSDSYMVALIDNMIAKVKPKQYIDLRAAVRTWARKEAQWRTNGNHRVDPGKGQGESPSYDDNRNRRTTV